METWKTHTPKYGCIFNLFSKEGETIGVHCRDWDSEHSSSQQKAILGLYKTHWAEHDIGHMSSRENT